MTDQPWTCGDACPFRGCAECAYKGGGSYTSASGFARRDGRIGHSKTAPAGNRGLTPDLVLAEGGLAP